MRTLASDGFPALVRRVRSARGLTQEGLARELGVSFATVNGWENGRHRPIPVLARRLEELGTPGNVERQPEPVPSLPEVAARSVDGSGWPFTGRERRDFYHGPREFPPDVHPWRAALLAEVGRDALRFPASARLFRQVSRSNGEDRARDAVRELLDAGISHLREVARIVAALHGTPDLGNKADPVDELVYIILSRKTREEAYQQAYAGLKRRFPSWDDLLGASPADVERILRPSGLGDKKTASVRGALAAIRDRFGSCSLEEARAWPDAELETFLCSLPEVSRKSAYCVMMYAFGRRVFPVDTHVGRILSRIGIYRELGLDLSELDHKQLQARLADLVPPVLRRSLHVNLVVHGREVCHAINPACSSCDLRPLCATHRRGASRYIELTEAPTVADLFVGAGGLSEGFERAGFRIVLAVDNDPVALRTYRLNHPSVRDDRILCSDIRKIARGGFAALVGRKRVDVLIGAPPCQGFSHVGHRSKRTRTGYSVTDDERNYLYTEMIRVARELRPRLFLMENVPGMKSARSGPDSFIEAAERRLKRDGYATALWKVNAAAHGVPQDRLRYFLVAARDVPMPVQPIGEYQDMTARNHDPGALPPVTLDEAIYDLPARAPDEGTVVDLWSSVDPATDPRARRYLQKFGLRAGTKLLYGHTVRYHNARDLELYALLRPGEDSVHALERHDRSDLMRYRSDVFDDKYARLRGDRPCKTIVAHLAKDGNGYIHPSQVRSLSLREAARVQSFRDDYIFCGSPSDQWVQLGNAVPPILAEALARSLMEALHRGTKR